MKTQTLTIDIPSDVFIAANETVQEMSYSIKLMLAVRLYENKKITIGKATQLAGMHKIEFENFLATNKIPISNLEWIDIEQDILKLR